MFTYAQDDGSGIFASVATISKLSGESERTVERAITQFRKDGWLTDEGMYDHGNGQPTKMRRLVLEKILYDKRSEGRNTPLAADTHGFFEGSSTDTLGGKDPSFGVKRPVTSGGCSNIEEPREEPTSKNQELIADFEEFWKLYPYRVSGDVKSKNGKQKAAAKYAIARRKHSHVFLVEALHKFRASCNPKYVPDAARWLGDSMFNNEILAAPAAKPDSGMKWL
jgi:hypothetical protein